MRRFPLRTLLLMIVALLAFLRLWWVTHANERARQQPQHQPVEIMPAPPPAGSGR